MKEYLYEECYIGLKESFEVMVTEDQVVAFRDLTGDHNLLHNQEAFAKENGFQGKVVYGMLTASFLSTLAGMYLPGKYCLIHEVNVKFLRPVYIGETLNVSGEVIERSDLFQQIVLKVKIENQKKEKVARGKIQIGLLKKSEEA